MNKLQIFGKVSGAVMKAGGTALLKCRQYSPEILLLGSLACGIGAIVTAVSATKKACKDEVLEQTNKELQDIDSDLTAVKENDRLSKEEKRDDLKEIRRDLMKVYWKKAKRIARIYAIPFVLALAMVIMGFASRGILRARYLSTVAAYTALDNSYKDYRQRIRDIAGEEAEQRFFDGTDEIEIKSKDPETGKTVKEKVAQKKQGIMKRYSQYEYDFNPETAPYASTGNADHDYNYLVMEQGYWRDILASSLSGFVLLIDVLDKIGIQVRDPQTGKLLVDPKLGWERGDDLGFGISQYYDAEEYIREARSGNQTTHLNFNAKMLPFLA